MSNFLDSRLAVIFLKNYRNIFGGALVCAFLSFALTFYIDDLIYSKGVIKLHSVTTELNHPTDKEVIYMAKHHIANLNMADLEVMKNAGISPKDYLEFNKKLNLNFESGLVNFSFKSTSKESGKFFSELILAKINHIYSHYIEASKAKYTRLLCYRNLHANILRELIHSEEVVSAKSKNSHGTNRIDSIYNLTQLSNDLHKTEEEMLTIKLILESGFSEAHMLGNGEISTDYRAFGTQLIIIGFIFGFFASLIYFVVIFPR